MVNPLLKLGTLAIRTISKPIAAKLKQQAGVHPRFREIIIRIAQANHQITTKMQRRIYSHATDVEIRPLNEDKAVQAAVDLFGELFVFTVAGAAVIFEWQRGTRAEARKEELRKNELETMRNTDDELEKEIELLKHRIIEMEILKKKFEQVDKLAKGRGLGSILSFRHSSTENDKGAKAAA